MSVWLFTGLVVLTAGVLAALQFLRARPEKRRVVTSLFWKELAKQVKARTLFGAFRNPLTYLLLLLASLLVLLALAVPIFGPKNEARRVIVLEAGIAMTANDARFENARELVKSDARGFAEERVAVIVADPYPRVLKRFDEGLGVMEGRLAEVKPAGLPVSRDNLVGLADSLVSENEESEIVLVAAQPVDLDQVRVLAAGGVAENAFVFSPVFVPDSAASSRGAFRCRVGFTGEKTATFTATITRRDESLSKETFEIEPGATRIFTVADLPADGSVLSVALDGSDMIAGDNDLQFTLPNRSGIRLVPVPGFEVPPVLAAVVRSLPEVSLGASADPNEIVLRIGPTGSDADIQMISGSRTVDLLPVRALDHPLVADLSFEDALCRAPSDYIGRPDGSVSLLMAEGGVLATLDPEKRQLLVAASFFDEDASVVRRTGYFVFWSNLIHYLAGWSDEPRALSPEEGARLTEARSSALVTKAGFENFNLIGEGEIAQSGTLADLRPPVWQWLILGALVLMLVEALLHLRGKIT